MRTLYFPLNFSINIFLEGAPQEVPRDNFCQCSYLFHSAEDQSPIHHSASRPVNRVSFFKVKDRGECFLLPVAMERTDRTLISPKDPSFVLPPKALLGGRNMNGWWLYLYM